MYDKKTVLYVLIEFRYLCKKREINGGYYGNYYCRLR